MKVVNSMDCCSHTGIKENDGSFSSALEDGADHLTNSCDTNDHAVHSTNQKMPKFSLERCFSETNSSPVQCTEDMPQDVLQKDIEEKCTRTDIEGFSQSHVIVSNEDVDLTHETWQDENGSHHNKALLVCVADPRNEKQVNKEELRLKYFTEENTNRKRPSLDQVESAESGPLDIMPFLKYLPVLKQEVCINMLHSSTQVSSPIHSRLSEEFKSVPTHYLSEMNRLATYLSYPSDIKVFAITLASNGFIYLPDEQSVECCFCKFRLNLQALSTGANPKDVHFSMSSHCPLKQGENCGNVPVKEPIVNANGPVSDRPDHIASSGKLEESMVRTSGGDMYQVEAPVYPSPVIQCPPAAVLVTNSVAPTSFPCRNADGRYDSKSFCVNLQSATVPDSVPLIQQSQAIAVQPPVNTGRPSTAEMRNQNKASSLPPRQAASVRTGSEQNGASALASASASRASKSSKKSKTAKKADAATNRLNSTSSGGTSSSSSSASAPSSSGNKCNNGSSSPGKVEQGKEKKLTYADLGIYADKPKRPDMAALPKRLASFDGKWKSSFAKTKEELGECGMYYAGYADCARCFFCGGGLKNWEAQDEPWVEHARWFPKCGYLLLCKGLMFVDIIQTKNRNNERIQLKDVEQEIKQKNQRREASPTSLPVSASDGGKDTENQASHLRELEAEHEELSSQFTCKICMDERSSVVFLPCGHMVACTDCAVVLKNCPLCRSDIRGSVKAYMDG